MLKPAVHFCCEIHTSCPINCFPNFLVCFCVCYIFGLMVNFLLFYFVSEFLVVFLFRFFSLFIFWHFYVLLFYNFAVMFFLLLLHFGICSGIFAFACVCDFLICCYILRFYSLRFIYFHCMF